MLRTDILHLRAALKRTISKIETGTDLEKKRYREGFIEFIDTFNKMIKDYYPQKESEKITSDMKDKDKVPQVKKRRGRPPLKKEGS